MKAVKWLWHWFFQGVKASLFILVASMIAAVVVSPVQFLLAMAEDSGGAFVDQSIWLKFLIVIGNCVGVFVAFAMFAFVLAAQLKAHPLCGPEASGDDPTKGTQNLPNNETR